MRERPILFSEPMVRAILAGRKSQTRRAVKVPVRGGADFEIEDDWPIACCTDGEWRRIPCPYGEPGDRLWVRERAAFYWGGWHYFADGPSEWGPDVSPRTFNRPSIHMPRSACRIELEIARVRVERLQSISEGDAIAEGIERSEDFFDCACWKAYGEDEGADVVFPDDPIGSYRSLWESINGAGAWDANPWVWVIDFAAQIRSQE